MSLHHQRPLRRAVTLVLHLIALLIPVQFAAAQGQAFNDTGSISTQHPDWMRGLAGTSPLATLSLPGTHDSMARLAPGTQSLGLRAQLDAGIRVLDIGVRRVGNDLVLYHGNRSLGTRLDEVLTTVVQFLGEHPTETVLMRVRQVYFYTRSFTATFNTYRNRQDYAPFIWSGTTLPTLQEVRGKIVILDDFNNGLSGINWRSLDIQDEADAIDPNAKWGLVKEQFALADAGSSNRMYVNFSSASCFGWESGPGSCDPKAIARTVNPFILEHLAAGRVQHAGILLMDFPGAGLIDAVIARNFQPTAVHFRTGDFNGDGRTDESWYSPLTREFIVLLSNGQGGFTLTKNPTDGLFGDWSGGRFFSTGDYNGDGRTDWSWYAPWGAGDFIVMLSNGQGGFIPMYNATSGLFGDWSGARFFNTGDYNGDGCTDWSWFAPGNTAFTVMLSNGQGGFTPVTHPPSSVFGDWLRSSHFSTGDYNGDGRTDWSWYSPATYHFIVMLSDGQGGFTARYNYTRSLFGDDWSGGRFFSAGDYNGDGRTDWSWYAPWSGDFIVMLSNGQGGFTVRYNGTASLFGNDWSGGRFFSTGDYNGDRRMDWSWYAPWTGDFIVMLSDGQGGFIPMYNATSGLFGDGSEVQFFSTGDYNGDGRTDWSWYAPGRRELIVMNSNGVGGFNPTSIPWSFPGLP